MNKDWDDFTPAERDAAKTLGYTKKLWDNDGTSDIADNDWKDLTPEQQHAATTLGYTRWTWDEIPEPKKQPAPTTTPPKKTFSVQLNTKNTINTAVPPNVLEAIVNMWKVHQDCDAARYLTFFAPDAIRASSRGYGYAAGHTNIAAALPAEWSELEKTPESTLAESLQINVQVCVPCQTSGGGGGAVVVSYVIDSQGGVRWTTEDAACCIDVWDVPTSTCLAHYTQWGMDDPPATNKKSKSFSYTFVQPVRSLEKGIEFYKPLVGVPVRVSEGHGGVKRAEYYLRAGGFVLEENTPTILTGSSQLQWPLKKARPTGYVEFHVADVQQFIANVPQENRIGECGGGGVVLTDPNGNVFVVKQSGVGDGAGHPREVQFTSTTPGNGVETAINWTNIVVSGTPQKAKTPPSIFLESSLTQQTTLGLLQPFPASASVILATLTDVQPLPSTNAFAYHRTLQSQDLSFQDHATCLMVVSESGDVIASAAIQRRTPTGGCVIEVDYVGYPFLAKSKQVVNQFYSSVLNLGKPYTDDGWFGWWSTGAVFGVFETDDAVPQKLPNGYISFWVPSAHQCASVMGGATFPHIPAINDKSGVEAHPGYIQVVMADPDGNVLLCTQYTGKKD